MVPATFTVDTLSDVIAVDGQLTLREAVLLANANNNDGFPTYTVDVIDFDPALNGPIYLLPANGQITITEDVIITNAGGPNDLVVHAAPLYRVFYVPTPGVDVTIDGLTITGGTTAGSGGGLYFNGGVLTLTDMVFDLNFAGLRGGAVYFTGTDLYIDNVDFTYNTAGYAGGALAINGTDTAFDADFSGNAIITNSLFDHNDSLYFPGSTDPDLFGGGGIYMYVPGNFEGNVAITYTDFTDNTAYTDIDAYYDGGGAVFISIYGNMENGSSIDFDNLLFDHNNSDDTGGALMLEIRGDVEDDISFTNIEATFNIAQGDGNPGGGGGGVYVYFGRNLAQGAYLLFDNLLFEYNDADLYAGGGLGIHIVGDVYEDITISNSNFNHNDAQLSGGAVNIYVGGLVGTGADIFILDSVFDQNSANTTFGGAVGIYVLGGLYDNILIDNSDFTTNNAQGDGGAVGLYVGMDGFDFETVASVVVTNSTFDNNSASGDGGALAFDIYGNLEGQFIFADSTSFTDNVANGDGGAVHIYTYGDLTAVSAFDITANFFGNDGRDGGALNIFVYGDVLEYFEIEGATMTYNNATRDGGAISVYVYGDVGAGAGGTILNNTLHHNTAAYNGGAIAFEVYGNMNGAIGVTSENLYQNAAFSGDGGAVSFYVYGNVGSAGRIFVTDSTLYRNTADNDGGGMSVFVYSNLNGAVDIENVDFMYNTATNGDGGGASVYVYFNVGATGSVNALDYTTFDHNSAGQSGGGMAVFVYGILNNNVILSQTDFTNNTAVDNGGAFYTYVVGDPLTLISVTGGGLIDFYDVTMSYNTAREGSGGGAFLGFSFAVLGDTYLTNVTIDNNVADQYGGGMAVFVGYSLIGNFELDTVAITNNTAANEGGGGLFLNVSYYLISDLVIQTSIFDNNDADTDGGGMFVYVHGNTFGNVDMLDLDFTNNTAGDEGAGFNIQLGDPLDITGDDAFYGDLTMDLLQVAGNIAGGDGGGGNIYIGYDFLTSLTLSNSNFDTNQSGGSGGGLFFNVYYDAGSVGDPYNTTIDFLNNDFSNNVAQVHGGGAQILIGDDLHGTFTILDNNFINNEATTGDGGGLNIYLDESLYATGSITIDSTTSTYNDITGNTAGGDGGGLSIKLGYNPDQDYFLDGPITVTQQNISNNTAGDDGGGLHIATPNYLPDTGYILIAYDIVDNNTAGGDGGGINVHIGLYLYTGATFLLHDVVISNNTSGFNGGGLSFFVGTYLYGSFVPYDLTITNNDAGGDGGGVFLYVGAAVSATSNIYLDNFEVMGNTAGDDGGGMAFQVGGSFYGNFTLNLSTVSDNDADGDGGGICINIDGVGGDGAFAFYESTIADNTAGGSGGGLDFFDAGAATFTLFASTISGNTTDYEGGGVRFYTVGGFAYIINSTISGNTAVVGSGGGFLVDAAPDYNVRFYNSTIAYNHAENRFGGGIFSDPSILLVSNLIGNNSADDDNDISSANGTFYAYYNLIENPGAAYIIGNGNVYDDPELVPLAFNGGPTQTHALLTSSPAINIGSNPLGLDHDQRGQPFVRENPVGQIDAGAFEFDPAAVPGILAVGAGPGGGPHVIVYNPDGTVRLSFFAFDPSFTGGVHVALGDINDDGTLDIIVGAGAGGGPHIKVFDGTTGAEIASFFAFQQNFSGGVYVASGDINNDGTDDIIVGAGAGGGPHIKVFDGNTLAELESFFAFQADFSGGVRVASGDVNDDNNDDIIVGAGPGGGPHVKAFDGNDMSLIASFFAFDPAFKGGVFVSAGDLNGDRNADIIVGAGIGNTNVRVFSGLNGAVLLDFSAYGAFGGGVHVGAVDLDQNGIAEIVTGAGPGGGSHVKVFSNTLATLDSFFAFPGFGGGVFVS